MKMLARVALALSLLFASAPVMAQHAATSYAPAGFAPEQACVTWSGATIGSGTLVPCPVGAGTSGKVDTVVSGPSIDIGANVAATTATTLAAANPTRRGFAVQNQTGGPCYLNGIATPTGNYHDLFIASGGYYESKDSHVGTGALQIYCAQAGGIYGRQW